MNAKRYAQSRVIYYTVEYSDDFTRPNGSQRTVCRTIIIIIHA